jgi:hypothetical protein
LDDEMLGGAVEGDEQSPDGERMNLSGSQGQIEQKANQQKSDAQP